MNRDAFVNGDHWLGTYYELAIELQSAPDDVRLARALAALWHHSSLAGPWPARHDFGRPPIIATPNSIEPVFHLYGQIKLPGGEELGCVTSVIREDQGSDWLDFSIPTGWLDLVSDVSDSRAAPFDRWRATVDEQLLAIADTVFGAVPFDHALIGEEVSGVMYRATISSTEVARRGGYLLSPELWNTISPNVAYRALSSGLRWVPFVP